MARNVLMTDHSRQSKQLATTVGFQFFHGGKSGTTPWETFLTVNNLLDERAVGDGQDKRP